MARFNASAARVTDKPKKESKSRPLARRRGELKREKILWAAAKIFAERGYSSTTLNDIAAAAGTQAGSLYYHFESRDDITREVLKCSMTTIDEHVHEAWARLPPDTPPIQKIKVGIRAHMATILSDDPFLPAYNRIINEVHPSIRDEFVQYPRAYGALWRALLQESQAAGEIRASVDTSVVRLLLLGSITWSQLWFDPQGSRSVDDIADTLIDSFFNGVLTEKGKAAAGAKPVAAKPSRAKKA
jgi:AcrR family transcriptional regulator